MIDQNQPYTSAPIEPGTTDAQITPVVPPPIETEPSVPAASSVVVPQNGGEVPKWFYFIFGVTLIVFLVVTTLLVVQITKKETPPVNIVPTATPQVTSSVGIPAVSSSPAQTTEGASDDIASIEADLKTFNLTVLDTSLNEVDKEASF